MIMLPISYPAALSALPLASASLNVEVAAIEQMASDAQSLALILVPVPILARCVRVVVGKSPDEQMEWIHARRIVALVEDAHPVRDRPVRQLPHHAVSFHRR